MKQLTTEMIRELNELAIKETEQYANNLTDLMKPAHQGLVYQAIINGGYHAINDITKYLLKQLKEAQQ